jgi:hypothetical protein
MVLGCWLACFSVSADPPKLDFLFPAGGPLGETVSVEAGSKLEPWPVDVWTDHPDLVFKAGEKKGVFEVAIGVDVPPGPHLVRVMNSNGVSNVKWFVVGLDPELREVEDNDRWEDAQVVSNFPVVVNGGFAERGAVDCFAVDIPSNQTLVVNMNAYGIDAGVDAMMYVLDAQGHRIAHVHDSRRLDPHLHFRPEAPGRYIVQLAGFVHPPSADVRFHGGAGVRYRLRFALIADGQEKPLASMIANGVDEPERLQFPMKVIGRIETPREEDLFAFEVKKGEHLVFTPIAMSVGSPLDPYLSIRDEEDRVLAKVDDTKSAQKDAPLEWTATKEGPMRLGIRDALYRHGPAYTYRIQVEAGRPGIRASTETDVLVIEAGKAAQLKLQVSRRFGDAGAWIAVAHELPKGVKVSAAELDAKGGELTLDFQADEKTPPGNTAIKLSVASLDPDRPEVAPVAVRLKGLSTPHEDVYPNTVEQVWLTVKAP